MPCGFANVFLNARATKTALTARNDSMIVFVIPSITIGEAIDTRPSIRTVFTITDPTIFPIARCRFFFFIAIIDTTVSGKTVPKPIITEPIITDDILKNWAIFVAELTTNLALITTIIIAPIKIAICFTISGVVIHGFFSVLIV